MEIIGLREWPVHTTVIDPTGKRMIATFPDVDSMLLTVNMWQQVFGDAIQVHIRTLGAQDN